MLLKWTKEGAEDVNVIIISLPSIREVLLNIEACKVGLHVNKRKAKISVIWRKQQVQCETCYMLDD